jgi:hypothetical protein
MIVTDTLNGHTVEDVRRNADGSITLFCDSGRRLTLYVSKGVVVVRPPKIYLPDQFIPQVVSERMRLLQAFQGLMVNYATYDDQGCITITCEPLRGRESYTKSCGHRTVKLTHRNGLIDDLPPVSAIVALTGLSVFGDQNL